MGDPESAATAATVAMQELSTQANPVPSSDLHFVLLGDSASDFCGFLNTFLPSLPGVASTACRTIPPFFGASASTV